MSDKNIASRSICKEINDLMINDLFGICKEMSHKNIATSATTSFLLMNIEHFLGVDIYLS